MQLSADLTGRIGSEIHTDSVLLYVELFRILMLRVLHARDHASDPRRYQIESIHHVPEVVL